MNEARERLRLVSLPFYKLQYYHNDIDATNGGVQCAVNNCYITVTVKDKDALGIKLTNPNIEFDLDEIKNSADRIIKVVGDLDQIKEALVIEVEKIVEVPIEVETIKREIVEVEKPRESLWTKAKRFFGFKK
jgi:hypothetical protein